MNNFFDIVSQHIDFVIVTIVLCSGFFGKIYLKGLVLTKDGGYDNALKTLIVSFIASTVYIVLIKDPEKPNNWAMYFLSYFFATSLYELLINPFVNWIKTKLPSSN
jgi:hypothetical protein